MSFKKLLLAVFIFLVYSVSLYASEVFISEREVLVRIGKERTEVLAIETVNGIPWMFYFIPQAYIGRNGASADKKEGDGRTPLGTFTIRRAFGLMPNPGTALDYTQIQPGDVWVDDSESVYYNRFISADAGVSQDWTSAENLAGYPVEYKYAFVIEYNTESPKPGAGSAIFFHCENKKPTSGCVSVPEDDMIWLLQWLRPGDKLIIEQIPDAR